MLDQRDPCKHVTLDPRTAHTTPTIKLLPLGLARWLQHPHNETYLISYLPSPSEPLTNYLSRVSSLQAEMLGEIALGDVDCPPGKISPPRGPMVHSLRFSVVLARICFIILFPYSMLLGFRLWFSLD